MRLLLIGFGVVGREFVKLLERRRGELYRRHGMMPRLVGVVDSRGAAVSERGLEANELLKAKDSAGTVAAVSQHGITPISVSDLIADSDADVLIEASPSKLSDPSVAMAHLKAAFRHGIHVVTVNKAPLAVAMPALLELARYNQVELRFSGAVGAGTPILALARECAKGDEILRVRGVLNGTTNYILSQMHDSHMGFEPALAEAIRLGFAETDPSADIDGIDTATKIAIFANWVCSKTATLPDLRITGIRGLARERIEEAERNGNVLKLLGEIGDTLSVSPQEVPRGSPLDVAANLNAVTLSLRDGGDVTLVGRGAGGVETATAILRDVFDVWKSTGAP